MHRVLVTGAAGFAGSHLVERLVRSGVSVVAWHRPGGRTPGHDLRNLPIVRWEGIDLLDRCAVTGAITDADPEGIFHLAGLADASGSWRNMASTLEANVLGTHYLLDAVRRTGRRTRVLVTSSALVYQPSMQPHAEDHPLAPASPYGVSKLAQEMLALRATRDERIAVVVVRPFNHIGPRQSPLYASASFAQQIARIEAGSAPPVLRVGNLESVRDLTDVRDTVRAYELLLAGAETGRSYNVASGRPVTAREVLDSLLRIAAIDVHIQIDETRLRPHDHPVLVGDPTRVHDEVGWSAEIPLHQTLTDLLNYWRRQVSRDV